MDHPENDPGDGNVPENYPGDGNFPENHPDDFHLTGLWKWDLGFFAPRFEKL